MKKYILIVLILSAPLANFAQKYSLEKSSINFFSHATLEDITADNTKTVGLYNASTKDLAFSIPIREFKFAKALMQEHFNEKYMESDKFPKSTFQGKIIGYDVSKQTIQQVKAAGKLTLHGVVKDVEIPGTIEKDGDKLLFKSKFSIKLEDYKVEIPQLLFQKIAEQVEVTCGFNFKPQ